MSRLIYNTGNFFYLFAINIASLWNKKAKKWVTGRKNWKTKITRFKKEHREKVIWMHCASLGEFEQGRPVFELLKQQYASYHFVLSFFSSSGYENQKNYALADAVFYLPVNTKKNADFFINQLDPALVLWIKYDYWSNFLLTLKSANIPLLLLSAKFNKKLPFFKFYGSFWVKLLQSFTHIFTQDTESANLLNSIGITQHSTVGDTRFDRVIAIAKQDFTVSEILSFCDNKIVFIAGSTWLEDEEKICHFANKNQEMRFIIAPHDIQESRLLEIEALFKKSCRYSVIEKNKQANVLIIDNIGILAFLYRYANICYLGGGFGADGIHNALEAAVYGKPIIFGPEYDNYKEAVDLVALDGAIIINDALELEASCTELLNDTNLYDNMCTITKNYVLENEGSSKKIMAYVTENLLLTRL